MLSKLIIPLKKKKKKNYTKSVLYTVCDVTNFMCTKQNRLRAKTSHRFIFQRNTSVVWVPSGRWQSCPVQESWPPSAAVGIMPTVSPSLSSPQTFPHQPAGTERKTKTGRDVFQDSRVGLWWYYPGGPG